MQSAVTIDLTANPPAVTGPRVLPPPSGAREAFTGAFSRYAETSTRTSWEHLPRAVRATIMDAVGGHPAQPPGTVHTGFSRGFAALVHPENHPGAFVRAIPESEGRAFRALTRETRVLRWLPAETPAPRYITSTTLFDSGQRWHVAVSEAIRPRRYGPPTTESDIAEMHETLIRMAGALPPLPPTLQPRRIVDGASAGAGEPSLYHLISAQCLTLPAGIPHWVMYRGKELAALARFASTELDSSATCHAAMRPDVMLFENCGDMRLTGWHAAAMGPLWADWVVALAWCRAAGVRADDWLHHSALTASVPPAHIDAFLAAYAATHVRHLMRSAAIGYGAHVAMWHRDTACLALKWLAARRHWAEDVVISR